MRLNNEQKNELKKSAWFLILLNNFLSLKKIIIRY